MTEPTPAPTVAMTAIEVHFINSLGVSCQCGAYQGARAVQGAINNTYSHNPTCPQARALELIVLQLRQAHNDGLSVGAAVVSRLGEHTLADTIRCEMLDTPETAYRLPYLTEEEGEG